MPENKTSQAVSVIEKRIKENPWATPEDVMNYMLPLKEAKAIAEKFKRMEEALQKIERCETDCDASSSKKGCYKEAEEALSFDPLA